MKQKNNQIKVFTAIIGWTLFGISFILAILFYTLGISENNINDFWVSLILKWAYILGGLAAILAFIIVPIFNALQNTKSLIKFGIAIVLFLILLGISYSISDASGVPNVNNVKNFDQIVLWSDTGLHMFYILSVLGILAILAAEVKNLFK